MRSVLLTDWITIRGSGTTPVVQSEVDWLDVPEYADAIFWVEIAEVTNPGSGTVALLFETAPAAFESLFATLDSVDVVTVGPAPILRKTFLNQVANVPLARFLRWKLVGSAAGTWDVTFRVHVTLGQGVRSAVSPRSLPGLLLWFRSDLGLTLQPGNKVSQWNDLSGLLAHFVFQGTEMPSRPIWVPNAIGGRPALDFSGSKFLENTFSNVVAGAGSSYSVLAVAKGGDGNLFALRRSNTYSGTRFQTATTWVYGDGVNAQSLISVANTLAVTQSSPGFKSCHRYNGVNTWPDVFLNGSALPITSNGPPPAVNPTAQTLETGSTGFHVGTDPAGEFWNGQIAELIVMSGAISDADRVRIELYQRNFFGV